jgi:hypothetical protein
MNAIDTFTWRAQVSREDLRKWTRNGASKRR